MNIPEMIEVLQAAERGEALEYHQEQTRPIQKTIEALAAYKELKE